MNRDQHDSTAEVRQEADRLPQEKRIDLERGIEDERIAHVHATRGKYAGAKISSYEFLAEKHAELAREQQQEADQKCSQDR